MTRWLLDTHLLLWWLSGDPRLTQQVVERVQAPGAEVFVSQASLWEIAIKLSIGRLQVDLPDLERQVPLQGFIGRMRPSPPLRTPTERWWSCWERPLSRV